MDEEELLSLLPKGSTDREGVRQMLFYLRDHDYLDVEYAEEGLYCVRPLPEGRLYFERIREKRRVGLQNRLYSALVAAGSGFLGGFLGALLAAIVG